MLTGALILLGGIIAGRFLPNVRRGPRPPKQPKAICGCDHHLSMHDPKTLECKEIEEQDDGDPILSPGGTYIVGYKNSSRRPCNCRQYAGPKPAEMYFSTPLILPQGDES